MTENPFPLRCFMRIFVLCSIKHLSQTPQAAARIVLTGYKENTFCSVSGVNTWQRLPRKVMDSSPFKRFKIQLHKVAWASPEVIPTLTRGLDQVEGSSNLNCPVTLPYRLRQMERETLISISLRRINDQEDLPLTVLCLFLLLLHFPRLKYWSNKNINYALQPFEITYRKFCWLL